MDYNTKLLELHSAFERFHDQYKKITWKAIVSKVKSKKDFEKNSLLTIQRKLGFGANSALDKEHVQVSDFRDALKIISAVSEILYELYERKIEIPSKVDGTQNMLYNGTEFYILDKNGNRIQIDDTNKNKHFYEMYYWSYRNGIQKGEFIFNDSNVQLIINKGEKNENKLIGEKKVQKDLIYLNFPEPKNTKQNVLSQFVLRIDDINRHDTFFCTYSTATRGRIPLPLAGIVMLHKVQDFNQEQNGDVLNFAIYNLVGKRINIRKPSFNLHELKKIDLDEVENDFFINSFRSWKKINDKVHDSFEGFLLNQFNNTFESFYLSIEKNGRLKICFKACCNENKKYYEGIARIVGDVLILRYDYKAQFRNYRIKMMFNILNLNFEINTKVFGNYQGFPRQNFQSDVAGKTAIIKISDNIIDMNDYYLKAKNSNLNDNEEFKKVSLTLKEKGVFEYFFK